MLASHFVQRISRRRDTVGRFDRYPFSLQAVRHLDVMDPQCMVRSLPGPH